ATPRVPPLSLHAALPIFRPGVGTADVLKGLPLHGVLGGDLTKLLLDNIANLRDAEGISVGSSTIVLPTLLLCQRIEGAESHRRRSEEHTSELQSRENLVC